jgi:hypothetical protein
MPVLQLVSSVKQREFMKAIRAEPFGLNIWAELEEYAERQPTLASMGTVPPWMNLFKRFGGTDPGVFEQQIVATRLRMYVDEWIDTGVSPDVGEVPLKRDLEKAPGATELLREYVKQHRPTLPVSSKRLEFVFEFCRPAVAGESFEWPGGYDPLKRRLDCSPG